MEYHFQDIERKWRKYWKENNTYRTVEDTQREKCYVLDMFPYPSGAGLHVGHPLGYIASDIYSRFKRMKGFNVLHPMGYDAFGLPAEQYAIQTGQHPAVTTEKNIERYREQMDLLGFSFDWDREVRTCDPAYYKWTQWIFIQLFHHWFNKDTGKAEPISTLITTFGQSGNQNVHASAGPVAKFDADQWKAMSEDEQRKILLNYRLAYLSEAVVNWCPELGTVLANDEVKDGRSERGGYPVVQKKMKQWSLRITAYAERLLQGLDEVDWSDALKEIQRNWIGKSHGANIFFHVEQSDARIQVFTTRPDTIFGATFMVLAPEHELVAKITTDDQKAEVENYIEQTSRKTERDRMANVKTVSGCFTGAYAINPFNNEKIPVWIADYVLAGYGTGAIMAVPSGDERDWRFAKHYNLNIVPVIEGQNVDECAEESKDGVLINSDFLNGMKVQEAIKTAIKRIEELGIGKGTINYKLRDAVFGRQRYWGEPIPVYYKNGIPYTADEDELPVVLPEITEYKPTESGEAPLARAKNWKYKGKYAYEQTTMPGWAGSSWYWLRYMDPGNENHLVASEKEKYWQQVDLYIGGSEHATGHLLYSRFWNHFLHDLGVVSHREPFKKLVNQGMILGISEFITEILPDVSRDGCFECHVLDKNKNLLYKFEMDYVSVDHIHLYLSHDAQVEIKLFKNEDEIKTYRNIHRANIDFINNNILDIARWLNKQPEYNPVLICNSGIWHYDKKRWTDFSNNAIDDPGFKTYPEVEKMSKSKLNVVSPDRNPETGKEGIVERYGADTLRLYEMFLGPLTIAKPWDTKGIEGTFRFLKKMWGLFYDRDGNVLLENGEATKDELKVLHKTIKKTEDDIERLSFNTAVSQFMICVNELSDLKCNKRSILDPLVRLVAPFAPHIAEELWQTLGHKESICYAGFPVCDEAYLADDTVTYPVSFNGKTRFTVELPADLSPADIEKEVMAMESSAKWLDGKQPRKVIVVPGRIVNVVV